MARAYGRSAAGFTVLELLLVLTVGAIVAAIAVPSLIRARSVAVEVSTIGSLRAIHGAQMSYASSCAGGYYSPTMASLATAPKVGGAAFIGPEFKADSTDRQQYRIRLSPGTVVKTAKATCNGLAAGLAVDSFFVGADLLSTTTGMASRYFGVNHHGVFYESSKRVVPFYTGVPPSPAKQLK